MANPSKKATPGGWNRMRRPRPSRTFDSGGELRPLLGGVLAQPARGDPAGHGQGRRRRSGRDVEPLAPLGARGMGGAEREGRLHHAGRGPRGASSGHPRVAPCRPAGPPAASAGTWPSSAGRSGSPAPSAPFSSSRSLSSPCPASTRSSISSGPSRRVARSTCSPRPPANLLPGSGGARAHVRAHRRRAPLRLARDAAHRAEGRHPPSPHRPPHRPSPHRRAGSPTPGCRSRQPRR